MISKIFQKKLVEGRTCGACKVCCTIFTIDEPEVSKPAGVLCPHSAGDACAIYSARPDVCRNWFCLWRLLADLPDDMRPDLCGLLFNLNMNESAPSLFEKFYINVRVLDNPDAFESPQVKSLISIFIDDGNLPVWVSYKEIKRRIYPGPQFADAIENPTTTTHQDLVHMGQAWLKNYEKLRKPSLAK